MKLLRSEIIAGEKDEKLDENRPEKPWISLGLWKSLEWKNFDNKVARVLLISGPFDMSFWR